MVHFLHIMMVLKDPRFKGCERIYDIDFSLFLKIKSLDMLVYVYQIVSYLKISLILLHSTNIV